METREIIAELEAVMRQLCELKNRLRKLAGEIMNNAGAAAAGPVPDLFTQMGMEPLGSLPELEKAEPERAEPEEPEEPETDIPADAEKPVTDQWPVLEKRKVQRLENKMEEAMTVRVAEALFASKGFHQRMNIEKMVVRRTGKDWEAVRVAMNQAIAEQQPVCYFARGGQLTKKKCRFYRTADRDRLIERTVELLSA